MAAGRRLRRQAHDVIGVLDVGTAKTACVIAATSGLRSEDEDALAAVQVLGIGHQPTRGLRAGVVTELDGVEQAVRAAVAQAERMAGTVLEEVFLAVACHGLRSSTFTANTEIEDRLVDDEDMERLLDAGRTYTERDGRTLLHMNCISYRLDGAAGIGDPRGMAGIRLAADLHAVTAEDAPLHNLLQVVERAYLSAAGLAPAPLASGLAATTEEERHLGVVSIDMGAGTTAVSIFAQGHLLWSDLVPVGGGHVTSDIARALAVPALQAERIKKECGTLARTAAEDDEAFFHAPAGADVPALDQAAKNEVREIVRGRLAGHFRHVAQRIKGSGVARHATERVVLAGGASLQPGLNEFAAEIFGRPVRLARIEPLPGMPTDFCSPAFSTATGLVRVALDPAAGVRWDRDGSEPAGYLGRVGQWLRESF